MNSPQSVFLNSTPAGVSFAERDSNGLLVSWTENGYRLRVVRDSGTGDVALYATRGGTRLVEVMKFDGSGKYIRSIGEFIPTAFGSELRNGVVGGGGSTSSTIAVAASRTATANDSGATLELASNTTYTLDSAVALPAGVSVMGPTTGTATLAVSGGATINGGTTSISVSAGQLYAVVPRASSASAYIVRGS